MVVFSRSHLNFPMWAVDLQIDDMTASIVAIEIFT